MNRKKKKRTGIILRLIIVFLIIILAGVFFVMQKYSLSDEKSDLTNYFGLSGDDQVVLVLDDAVMEEKGKIIDGNVYLDVTTVQNHLNSRFYFDHESNSLLYTLPDTVESAKSGEASVTSSGSVKEMNYVPFIVQEDQAFIALEYVKAYTNISAEVFEDPNRVQIISKWGDHNVATIKDDTQIREKGGVKSPILTEISKGATVEIMEEGNPWTKVHSEDGFIGYVQNKRLSEITTEEYKSDFVEPEYTGIQEDYQICMAWHQVTNMTANGSLEEVVSNAHCLNTIAPTWFFLENTNGDIYSLASADYVNTAHSLGLKVWAVMNDFDGQTICNGPNSTEETAAVLQSTSVRNHIIEQIISEAVNTGIDGINVDYEKVSEESEVDFEQFIRELSAACHSNGLILSVDNYVPTYTPQYNRYEEGVFADYFIIMGYDEHGPWSHEVGSVASLPYVTQGVQDTIDLGVNPSKIILGVPFYTRLWHEKDEGGNTFSFTCETMNMKDAQDAVSAAGATIEWNEEAGQNYATWILDNATAARIWLEDGKSIDKKLELMQEKNLAGAAMWKISWETPDIWDVISNYF